MTSQTIPAPSALMMKPTVTLEQDDTCDEHGPGTVANTAVLLKSGNRLTFCNHCYRKHHLVLAPIIVAVYQRTVK